MSSGESAHLEVKPPQPTLHFGSRPASQSKSLERPGAPPSPLKGAVEGKTWTPATKPLRGQALPISCIERARRVSLSGEKELAGRLRNPTCFLNTVSREKALCSNQRRQDYKGAIQGRLGWRAQGEGVHVGPALTAGPLVLPPADAQQGRGAAQRKYGNDIPSFFFPK